MLFSPRPEEASNNTTPLPSELPTTVASVLAEKSQFLASLSKGFTPKAIKLLVAVSSLLTVEDHNRLGPHLWYRGLMNSDSSMTAAVSRLHANSTTY